MKVRVRVLLLPVEEELARGAELEMPDGILLSDLVLRLCAAYSKFKEAACGGGDKLASHMRVALAGRLAGINEAVPPGGEVVFFPALAGG